MTAAAVDIGTNTVLLLVGTVRNGRLQVHHEEQRIPRLGKGADATGWLAPDRMEAVCAVLAEYRDLVYARFGEIPILVTATAAVRDASNRIEFLWMVESATGLRIRILSGEEEARITRRGALSRIDVAEPVAVLDIGGGSTEWAADIRFSLPLGSVRVAERFGLVPPVARADWQDVRDGIGRRLREAGLGTYTGTVVGVAGTATVLGRVLGTDRLRKDALEALADRWIGSDPERITAELPEVLAGRGDVILAGLTILLAVCDTTGVGECRVSDGGIRHGWLFEWAENGEGLLGAPRV